MNKRWILGITTLAFTLVSCSLFSVSSPTPASATIPVVTRSTAPGVTPSPTATLKPPPTPTPSPTPDDTFAIYLVDRETSAAQLSKIALQNLELEKTPILSADDVVTYVWESHEAELTPAAYERLFEFSDSVSTSGRPFVVCVGSQRVYASAFWMPFSSQSFDGVAIVLIPSDERTIRIQLGYPGSPDLFMWLDPRSDPRILRSLGEAGKLK
jgi:hypothetical protein